MLTKGLGGYFNLKKFVEKKTLRVLVPYFFWAVFLVTIQRREWFTILLGVSHLWYLLFIFEAYISFRFVDKWYDDKTAKWFLISSLVVLLLANIISRFSFCTILGLDKYLRYMPYFVMGVYIYGMDKFGKPLVGFLASLILFSCVFATTHRYFFLIVPGTLMSVSIFLLVLSWNNLGSQPLWVQSLDSCSMGIYILHHIIIQQVNASDAFHPLMLQYIYIYPMCLFVVTFSVSWLISYVMRKKHIGKLIIG